MILTRTGARGSFLNVVCMVSVEDPLGSLGASFMMKKVNDGSFGTATFASVAQPGTWVHETARASETWRTVPIARSRSNSLKSL